MARIERVGQPTFDGAVAPRTSGDLFDGWNVDWIGARQLQLEEDDGIDGRTTDRSIEVGGPLTNEGEIELTLKVRIEVFCGNKLLK